MSTIKWNSYTAVTGMVLIILTATSCIPTTTNGGNPAPSAYFTINISSIAGISENTNAQTIVLFIDGDSIRFRTGYSSSIGTSQWFWAEPLSGSYEYLTDLPSQSTYYNATPLSAGTVISNIPDSAHQWRAANNGELGRQIGIQNGSPFLHFPVLDLPLDEYRYIAFRKIKTSGHQYYWIRVKYYKDLVLEKYTLSVINGKYQMDSIITGQ